MGIFDSLAEILKIEKPPEPTNLGSSIIAEAGLGLTASEPGEFPDLLDHKFRGSPVGWSDDLRRIMALPRRFLNIGDPRAAEAWTKHLSNGRVECDCDQRWGVTHPTTGKPIPGSGCIRSFNALQGWALEESMDVAGELGSIGVGEGKTGIGIFLPMAIPGVRVAVLLLQANLKAQFLKKDFPQWSAHFKTPNLGGSPGPWVTGRPVLHVVTYPELSQASNSDLFRRLGPDLVIADEGQNLKNPKAARTMRFLRLFKETPNAKFCTHSGTITTKSLKDYAHLSKLALRDGSPMPIDPAVVDEWAGALDAGDYSCPIGMLAKLCEPGETAHQGYQRRFVQTRGVIATSENSLKVSLSLNEREIKNIPSSVRDALSQTRETWQRPDGEELVEALAFTAVCKQLASGFFYRWRFPRGESAEQIDAWLMARKDWFKEVREKLKFPREHADSPLLVTEAAIRWTNGYVYIDPVTHKRIEIAPHDPRGPRVTWDAQHWERWRDIKKTVVPETEAVWISEFLAEDAAEWARKSPGIVWYEHAAFGQLVARLGKIPHYGAGEEASSQILEENGKRSIVASYKAHGTGKNLQKAFCRNLIANPPGDGAIWEQLLGRTHRFGQLADEVTAEVYRHTEEYRNAIEQARTRARYIEQTTGSRQKLCSQATIGF